VFTVTQRLEKVSLSEFAVDPNAENAFIGAIAQTLGLLDSDVKVVKVSAYTYPVTLSLRAVSSITIEYSITFHQSVTQREMYYAEYMEELSVAIKSDHLAAAIHQEAKVMGSFSLLTAVVVEEEPIFGKLLVV
jgi:predicted acyltransferase (DUF342 family)